MKLRVYFRPTIVFVALSVSALLCALAAHWFGSWIRVIGLAGVCFYGVLALLAGYALARCHRLERWMAWDRPERLLILVPHEDDCVICAAGVGIRNQQLGGSTHIVYVVQNEDPSMAPRRKAEATAAWLLAGVPADHLRHLNLLPPLHQRAPSSLPAVTRELQQVVDGIAPTVVILPLFEGGHIHYDLLNHLVTATLKLPDGCRIFEAPEYSPYVSLQRTPHRVISLCGRCLGGLVAYYAPPDGIDDRPVWRVRLTAAEMALKRRMFAQFVSQNGDALSANRAYPDRLIRWEPRPYRSSPFDVGNSYLGFAQALQRCLPAALVKRILPGQNGTIGRVPHVTCLDEELVA